MEERTQGLAGGVGGKEDLSGTDPSKKEGRGVEV